MDRLCTRSQQMLQALQTCRMCFAARWDQCSSIGWYRETLKLAQLITFKSFADYADAERHQAELEAIAGPLGRTNVVAIESLPAVIFQESRTNGAASARQPDKPQDSLGKLAVAAPSTIWPRLKVREPSGKNLILKHREMRKTIGQVVIGGGLE